MEKLFYTAEETGRVLGVSRTMVFKLIAQGRLESVQIGRNRRIPLDALEAFAASLRGKSEPAA